MIAGGTMDILKQTIAKYNDNFSARMLANDSGIEKEKVTSLVHTLVCNGDLHRRKAVNHVPMYNRSPLPSW